MSGTSGGRDKLKNTDILSVYKSSLMSRGRLVTLEDVRSWCAMELSDKARQIEVRKGVRIGDHPGEGLVHTIEVQVFPQPDSGGREEWQDRARELESRLKSHSAAWVKYRISVTGI
jgi:hypothetical protein